MEEALEVKDNDIIIITESQLTKLQINKVHHQSILKLFTTHDPKKQKGSGVTIAIPRHLTTQVAKIFELNGYMLGILLHVSEFFLIIRVYNPPVRETAYNVNLPIKIDNELKALLAKAKQQNWKVILGGDLSSTFETTGTSKNHSGNQCLMYPPLHNTLQSHKLFDIFCTINPDNHRHTFFFNNNSSSSRLDYIYASECILDKTINSTTIDTKNYGPDHHAVRATINLAQFTDVAIYKKQHNAITEFEKRRKHQDRKTLTKHAGKNMPPSATTEKNEQKTGVTTQTTTGINSLTSSQRPATKLCQKNHTKTKEDSPKERNSTTSFTS
jgi:exonuclease III